MNRNFIDLDTKTASWAKQNRARERERERKFSQNEIKKFQPEQLNRWIKKNYLDCMKSAGMIGTSRSALSHYIWWRNFNMVEHNINSDALKSSKTKCVLIKSLERKTIVNRSKLGRVMKANVSESRHHIFEKVYVFFLSLSPWHRTSKAEFKLAKWIIWNRLPSNGIHASNWFWSHNQFARNACIRLIYLQAFSMWI